MLLMLENESLGEQGADPNKAQSCTGNVICYAGIPITWGSKLQTEFALALAKAKWLLSLSCNKRKHLFD